MSASNRRWIGIAALLGLSAIAAGCNKHADEKAAHAESPAVQKRTHYTDRTELYVEFPRLVAGEKAPFSAHLTTLPDFKALAAGRVSVILSGGGQPEESFSVASPAQPGIFRPEALPKQAGRRNLEFEIATSAFTVRHALGPVTVYADRKTAEAAPADGEETGVSFTKEIQWKVDFATAEAQPRVLRNAIAATGTLRARPDGEALLTAPAPGQLQSAGRFPQLGQAVVKGQVLAYLVPRLGGDTDLASLEANSRKAAVALDLATRERARMESLFKDEAVAEKRVQAARAGEDSARAELQAARQRLGQYGGSGGGVPIRAPIGGTIADVKVAPGAYAQEGALLFHIADRRAMWVELRVAESDAARLASPSGTIFTVEGIERGFEIVPGKNGRLVATGGVIDPVTRTLPVIFEFQRPDERLRIGMAVKAQVFAGPVRQALALPAAAVLDENGISQVFVQVNAESFRRVTVRTGVRDGEWVEIVEGLKDGERVVTRGAYLIKLAASRSSDIGPGHVH